MRIAVVAVLTPFLALAGGCSQVAYRPHVVPIMSQPKHPLPPEARTYRLVIEGESLLEPRLAAGIVVPGLERAACEVHTDVRVVVHAPGSAITVERDASQTDAAARGQRAGAADAKRKTAAPEDVVVTVGIGFAEASTPKVKEKTSNDQVPGQPDGPHAVFAYEGTWQIPQKLVVATKADGQVESVTTPKRVDYFFDRDPRTQAPFHARGTMQAAWAEAMPGLAMRATQDSLTGFVASANRVIEDDFLVRSTDLAIELADEHKKDPRFAEAARAFDAAVHSRVKDPKGFASKLAVPVGIWTAVVAHPQGTDASDQREAVGAATFDLAVARFVVDALDDADRLVLSAQAKGVDATEIHALQQRIAERRQSLAAQPAR